MNTREGQVKIKNTGTKRYPYYVIYEGKNEICHTIDIDNAKRVAEAIKCLASLPVVTDEEIYKACPQLYAPRLAAWMQGGKMDA